MWHDERKNVEAFTVDSQEILKSLKRGRCSHGSLELARADRIFQYWWLRNLPHLKYRNFVRQAWPSDLRTRNMYNELWKHIPLGRQRLQLLALLIATNISCLDLFSKHVDICIKSGALARFIHAFSSSCQLWTGYNSFIYGIKTPPAISE